MSRKRATSSRITAIHGGAGGVIELRAPPPAGCHVDVAAQFDVGSAASHVGGDGDGAWHAGLGNDLRLLFVEARVQHREHAGALAGAAASYNCPSALDWRSRSA